MDTPLKRKGTFLLGVFVGAMLSVSAAVIREDAPVMDIYRTTPENIDPAIEREYRPIHLENDLKLT